MKSLRIILVVLIFQSATTTIYAQKEVFLKQIEFQLDAVSDIDYENEYFMTIKLNKGSKYVFKIINGIDGRQGDAILELLDADNLILTNIYGDKYFSSVSFQCNKTAFYDILIKFKDNALGKCHVSIVLLQ